MTQQTSTTTSTAANRPKPRLARLPDGRPIVLGLPASTRPGTIKVSTPLGKIVVEIVEVSRPRMESGRWVIDAVPVAIVSAPQPQVSQSPASAHRTAKRSAERRRQKERARAAALESASPSDTPCS
jgi:hypothetical protein